MPKVLMFLPSKAYAIIFKEEVYICMFKAYLFVC